MVFAETALSTSHDRIIGDHNIVVMAGTAISRDPKLASRLERRGVQYVGEITLPLDIFSAPDDTPIDLTLGEGRTARLTEQQRFVRDDGGTLVIGTDETSAGSRFTAFLKDSRLTRLEIRRRDAVISLTAPEERGGALVFRVLVIDPRLLRDELPSRETGRSSSGHNRDTAGPTGDEGEPDANTLDADTDSQHDPEAMADTIPLDPPTVVNVMVVYTKDAADEAFDIEGLHIELLIEVTVLVTSIDLEQQTNIALNLVHTQQVPYVETGSIAEDIRRLECPCDIYEKDIGDNHLNEVFEPWRETQADIVSLWTYSPSESGIANIMSTVNTSFAPRAVSVVDWWHAIYNYSFAHEIGHNFGARHDRAWDNTNNAPYHYNHGFVNYAQQQVTVMAYKKTCLSMGFFCTRHWYWSDPTMTPINTWGLPSFIPLSADNAKALRASAPTTSNLQSRKDLVGCCKRRGTIFNRVYEPGSCNW
jgi:hypothetical protein